MVEEVYSPAIHMESMCRLDHAPVESGADLHALEDRLYALIPRHRHELVRVIAGRTHACLETTVVSPTTGEFAPACVWWWMGSNGQVDEEVGFFDWERRSTDAALIHGFVPPYDTLPCHASPFVHALRGGRLAAVTGPSCVIEDVGKGSAELAFGMVEVQEIVVDGPIVAVLVVGRVPGAVWRGTVVMTMGSDGGLLSVRCYGDPSTAVAVDAVHPAMRLKRQPTGVRAEEMID
jgi:hypothetical protein